MSGTILLLLRVALAVTLYAFCGWAFLTLWQDIRRQSKLLVTNQAPPLTLIQQAGDEQRSYRFTHPVIMIGRDPACDFHLEDKTISAQHARLSYHHGQWWVEDLRSTNGSFINQEPLAEPLVLTAGDELRFGQVLFQVAISEGVAQEAEFSV